MRAGCDRQGARARECLTPSTHSCCAEGRSGGLAAGAGKEAAFLIRHWIADRDSEAIATRSEGSGELVRYGFHLGRARLVGAGVPRGVPRQSDCRPTRGAQYSHRDRSLALADVIGLLGFLGMESTKLGRKQLLTNSARVRDRERSDRRRQQTRRRAPNPCECLPFES